MLPLCVAFLFIWNFQLVNLLLEICLLDYKLFDSYYIFILNSLFLGFYTCKQCILIKSSVLYLQLPHISLINILSSSYIFFRSTEPTKPGRMNVVLVLSTARSSLCNGHIMKLTDTALPKPTVTSSYSGSWLQDSVRAVNWWESSCAVPLPCLGKKHSKQPSTYLENLSIPSWVSTAEPWGKTHDTDVSFRTDYSTVYWTQFYKLWTTIYS